MCACVFRLFQTVETHLLISIRPSVYMILLMEYLKHGNVHSIFDINLLMDFVQVCLCIILIGTIWIIQKVLDHLVVISPLTSFTSEIAP